jgi:hypothetical protein
VNAVIANHLANANAAVSKRGRKGFDGVDLGGRVQVGKIQPYKVQLL